MTRWQVLAAMATMMAMMLGTEVDLQACAVCFGAAEGPMVHAAQLGVAAMLAMTFGVQGAFVGFFFYLRKRSKDNADAELDAEWSEVQRAGRTR